VFERAYLSNPSVAVRVLFWARDIRGGSGERDTFRKLMLHMEARHPEVLSRVIHFVPEYGRWDDLLIFNTPRMKLQAYGIINRALRNGNGLAAKWMPRKGNIAAELRDYMNETPKGYRKLLVNLTNVVEQKMCSNQWSEINYSHVPSIASARYQNTFNRRDASRYTEYKQALVDNKAKINASAIYPHDVIKSLYMGDADVARAQWNSLPNYLGDDFIIPMIDVSGSMECPVGGSKNLNCMDVAVSLGLYLADKQTGAFNGMFLTFSANSKIRKLSGDIVDKVQHIRQSDWGMNTSLESAFTEILSVARNGNVPNNQMPRYLLILSDMEFDAATRGSNPRAIDMARAMYNAAGYDLPKIVFWNLNARAGNVPVQFREEGTALVSGFSPSILKTILAAKSFNPVDIMMDTVNSERYLHIASAL
ncbi:MAG: DUF2828 family protein, partial [Phycisphaerales bacterium]